MSKKQTKKLSVPRAGAEIQQEYQQLCANAGQLQFQMRLYARDLERIQARLEAVNNEAGARIQLDKMAAESKQTAAPIDSSTSNSQQSQAV